MAHLLTLLDTVLVILALYLINRWISARGSRLPPGPKPLPFIGNLLDLPKDYDWLHWAKHKELYGPISSVSVFGQNIIILSESRAAIDLLERRSAIYSDRPTLTFANMCGWQDLTSMLRYGDVFVTHRKNMRRFVGTKDAISQLHPIEEIETRRFLSRILRHPDDLQQHIRTLAGAIILKVSHGYTVESEQPDPLVELADKAVGLLSLAGQPGVWLVDVIPILQYLPDWFPGAEFKRIARAWRKCTMELAERPHQFVKHQMAAGTASSSLTSFFLEQHLDTKEEFVIKWSAATLYAGGADTTVSAIYSFFLVMILYPDVQMKGQAEIDSVAGLGRLPTFSDRPRLPYVNAMVKEVLRWNAVVPMCLPHVSMEDDVYRSFSIPKGSLLIANNWLINHDPENFHDPFTFKPDRFLGSGEHGPEMDPHSISFGYGRRICPGKELADASIFISIAMVLAKLNVGRVRDKSGIEIEPKYEVTTGVISHPKPFQCTISARSVKAEDLILSVEEAERGTHSAHSDATILFNLSLAGLLSSQL